MDNQIIALYKSTKKVVENLEKEELLDAKDISNLEHKKKFIEVIEKSYPDIKAEIYRIESIQASFTHEQKEHICSQIDSWIPHTDFLAYSKKELAAMIFGD